MMEAGREMDAAVATRVMGWRLDGADWIGADNRWAAYADDAPPFSGGRRPRFAPSTDIAAAWLVVERLQELGCNNFSLEWEREKFGSDQQWMYAMNVPRHVSGSKSVGMPDPVVLSAATAPLAICLAALRSVS